MNETNDIYGYVPKSDDTKTGFKNPQEFCMRIEEIKQQHGFDTYIESIVWFTEYESDVDIESISKFLNKKIINAIEYEAKKLNMLKDQVTINELF